MNASKEEARRCLQSVETLRIEAGGTTSDDQTIRRCLDRLETFLEAAVKKLPSEAAYGRERARRKAKEARPAVAREIEDAV